MDNYQLLANAIVERAAKDYKKALLKQKRRPDNEDTKNTVRSLERFFHSDWYNMLTKVNGDYLIETIKESVKR